MNGVAKQMQRQVPAEDRRPQVGAHGRQDAMTTKPRPARTARISMMLSVPASVRMETAIAENESNAPVIQRTTRTRCLGATRIDPEASASGQAAGG